ncbi:alpha/beta fold hydrolase [Paraburkholderia oxyphila]|uniref:alpha/beta fold hydrolase n=1 Tax=Paraburkholderia oxyphila TaxID=614212 RepID=UPI0004805D70|nr:alpha/beta fold hydrolase [Paraburkholderia oxyphila]
MPLENFRNGSLNVRQWGEGAPLLLVHGLGTSSDLWAHQLRAFASRYRVVAMDLPGFGRSQRLPGREDGGDGLPAIVDDLAELCSRLGSPVHYVGTSMGGFFGLALALARPDLLRSLVLCNTAARNVIPPEIVAGRLAALRTATTDELGEMVTRQALGPQADPFLHEWFRELIARNSAFFYGHYLSVILSGFDVADRLGEITLPALVLTGECDRVIPPAHGAELARRLSASTLHELVDTGHIACAEQPEAFNRAILDFLAGVDRIDAGQPTETRS